MHNGVRQCTWHQYTLGRRSMTDVALVSSYLAPYVSYVGFAGVSPILRDAGDIESGWTIFSASISDAASLICGSKVSGASCGGTPRTRRWIVMQLGWKLAPPKPRLWFLTRKRWSTSSRLMERSCLRWRSSSILRSCSWGKDVAWDWQADQCSLCNYVVSVPDLPTDNRPNHLFWLHSSFFLTYQL